MDLLQHPEQFEAAIRLEQARVDRNEHAFSLVLFEIGNSDQRSQERFDTDEIAVQLLAQSLRYRIRSTDEIGWFDDHQIGVLLPYTSKEGAQKFVDDINREVDLSNTSNELEAITPQRYKIYSYPSHWHFDNGDGHSDLPLKKNGQLYFKDIFGDWDLAPKKADKTLKSVERRWTIDEDRENFRSSTRNPLPVWKRLIDIFGALFGLVLALPFLLIHTFILKIVSPGPVFFRQQRIGYQGRPFKIWKLRTMEVNVDPSLHKNHVFRLINGSNTSDSEKPMTKLDNDPHIIPGGILLRKLCLDEMPQLINVLLGEMSLVGPRPPLQYEVEEFLKWQHRRFDAVPGMTGLWQVSGKNKLSFSQMIRLDIQYSQNKSLWLDLIILLKTPLAIVSQLRDSLVLQRKQQLMVEGEHV